MQVVVTSCQDPPVALQPVEMVERKGLGHPDTICDALAEEVSAALCNFYLERFGAILHHNVDKVLLVGGQSSPVFGGGELSAPIEIYLAGRATSEVKGVQVPVTELAVESCQQWLRSHLRNLDVARHVRIHCHIRPGSAELVDLFLRQQQTGQWLANDTSCGAGFAPLSPVEALVLRVERELRSSASLAAHPERGEDIKVMAVRHGERLALTVADAFVSRHVSSLSDYAQKREALRAHVQSLSAATEVEVNTGDDLATGAIYLTVTGTSAEAGDDGEAGRGNRHSGLITPYRPMTMESVAGKNPVSHVGKIYNIAAHMLANDLMRSIAALQGVECFLVSRVGRPVRAPQLLHLRCWLASGVGVEEIQPQLDEVIETRLDSLARLYEELLSGRITAV